MKRIARLIFTLASAASLLLAVALCALWVRSHWVYAQYDTYQRSGSATEQRPGGRLVQCGRFQVLMMSAGGVRLRDVSNEQLSPPFFTSPRPWVTQAYWMNAAGDQYPISPPGNMPMGVKASFTFAGIQLIVANYNAPDAFGQPMIARELSLTVPFWLLVLLALVLPAGWLIARRRRRRAAIAAGMCGKCGYDLRGTPDRCPECGTLSGS